MTLASLMLFIFGVVGQEPDDAVHFTGQEQRLILRHLAEAMPGEPTNRYTEDPAAAHFGQFLFFEQRFSSNGTVSCATCHEPGRGFADGKQLAQGLDTLDRHALSLFNVAANRWFFWDGRADSLWSQALQPLEHALEFGGDRLAIVHLIQDDQALSAAYERVFGAMPDFADRTRFPVHARPPGPGDESAHEPLHNAWAGMTAADQVAANTVFANLGKAIAAYERLLVSRDSAFDRFAAAMRVGEDTDEIEMTGSARRGLRLFIGRGHCSVCHAGPNFTDGAFHLTGVPPLDGGALHDPGRYDGAGAVLRGEFNAASPYSDDADSAAARRLMFLRRAPEQWGQFKTPGLRDVATTAPYMHQGQFESLEEVVRHYSTFEGARFGGHHRETILQPLELSAREIADLVAFLESLTGASLPASLLRQPESPIPPATGR